MKRVILLPVFLLLLMSLSSQTPQIKWWYDVKDMSFGNAASADVDGDGLPEIAFSTYRNDSTLHVLNAEDGSLLWKYNTGGCNDVAPLIYDVDLDGALEIVLPSSCVAKTFCFDALTGALEWQTITHGSDSPPTVADLDNDGKPEILHGEFNGYVICINGENGSTAWEITVDPNSWIQTAPAILDLDGDGQLDFVVANWSFGTNHKIFAFRGDNHAPLWESDLPGDVMYHGASFADLDKDGKPEIAIGSYDGTLYVLNGEDGSLCFSYTVGASYYVGAPTSIGDLNKDGYYEVVCIGYYKVCVLDHTGNLFWSYNLPGYAQSFRGAALVDVNDDGNLDAVLGTDSGELLALNGNTGTLLWSVDLAAHYGQSFEIDHGPVVTDFDLDGDLDVFVVGGHAEYPNIQYNYGRAYAVDIGSGGGPSWPMFRRDVVRSACVCDTTWVSLPEPGNPLSALLLTPNPSRGRVQIHFPGSAGLDAIEVEIISTDGRKVYVERLSVASAESMITLDLSGLRAGIYMVNLWTGRERYTGKLIRN